MKKKYKLRRILITLVSICAVFSMFCVPVAAASSGWTDTVIHFEGNELTLISDSGEIEHVYGITYDNPSESYWDVIEPSAPFFISRLTDEFVSVQKGDVFHIAPLSSGIDGYFRGYLYAYRFILWDYENDEYIGVGPWNDITSGGNGQDNYNVTWSATMINVDMNCERAFVGLQFQASGEGLFYMLNKSFQVAFGNPNSPEAPSYAKPDGSTFNDLHNKEDQILGDAQGGLDQASDMFGNTLSFLRSSSEAFLAVGALLTGLTGIGNNVIYGILVFSLSLGLFAFIFNMALSVADKVSRGRSDSDRK